MRHYLSVKRLLSGSAGYFRQKEIVTANAIKIIRIYGFPQCRNRKMIKEALESEVHHVHIWKFVLIRSLGTFRGLPWKAVKFGLF